MDVANLQIMKMVSLFIFEYNIIRRKHEFIFMVTYDVEFGKIEKIVSKIILLKKKNSE